MSSWVDEELRSIVSEKPLLQHPFYLAWNEGTLSVDQLQYYAKEYGAFIGCVAEAWEACGEVGYAEEERVHHDLWIKFARSIGADVKASNTKMLDLVQSYRDIATSSAATAIGSLYAFEIQQPLTAESKLKGLSDHYNHIGADETYFKVHRDDIEESKLLRRKMDDLTSVDVDNMLGVCRGSVSLLWDMLTVVWDDSRKVA